MPGFLRLDNRMPTVEPPPPALAGPWLATMAASLGIEAVRIQEFSHKMAGHGMAIDPSRFFFDPFYAYKRLSLAKATDDDPLKVLTAELFERYQALERRRRNVSAFSRPH